MSATIEWRCPKCRGRLLPGLEQWSCDSCRAAFDALRGIPDLRTRDDVYLDNAGDRAVAGALLADFDRCSFRELLGRYFDHCPEITPEQRARQTRHILSAPGRVPHWLDALGVLPSGPLLDLGCGSGSFLAAVGHTLPNCAGVDIALRWLLVARKRLDEEGLGHVPLVCACAEDLPVVTGGLGAVLAGDVIEHVADQPATLAEIYRVLGPGGKVFLASPNRYSLAPEPHVGVWGVGFLPRRWMGPYVQKVAGVEYRAVRNLGVTEWRRLLRGSPFMDGRITVPALPPTDLTGFGRVKAVVARGYNALVPTRVGQWAGRAAGPLFHVVCQKPSPATPRGSRPWPGTRARRSFSGTASETPASA